jgi:hypothetical protein
VRLFKVSRDSVVSLLGIRAELQNVRRTVPATQCHDILEGLTWLWHQPASAPS